MNKVSIILALFLNLLKGEAAIWNSYPELEENVIESLHRIAPKNEIPNYLVGHQYIYKQDIPGEELSPADFDAARLTFDSDFPIDLEVDPITNGSHFQGDIIIPKIADLEMLKMNEVYNDPPRNAIIDESKQWENAVIPYTISASFGLKERAIIARAISEFHTHTCIKFVPRASHKDYVHFAKETGCSSAVGRTGGKQVISIGTGCEYKGIIMHEIMHACGFWHEQSRADRDKHVSIIYSNILSGLEYNFQKYGWNVIQNLGVGYDTGSLLHYGRRAFAKDKTKDTIIPKDLNGPTLGQRKGFSTKDKIKLNRLYRCKGTKPPTVTQKPVPLPPDSGCQDNNDDCKYWQSIGECAKNPWMKTNCLKSCNLCDVCEDNNIKCAEWKYSGHCKKQASYMQRHCKKSCGLCHVSGGSSTCSNDHKHCQYWSDKGECRVNESYMLKHCKKSCNAC